MHASIDLTESECHVVVEIVVALGDPDALRLVLTDKESGASTALYLRLDTAATVARWMEEALDAP